MAESFFLNNNNAEGQKHAGMMTDPASTSTTTCSFDHLLPPRGNYYLSPVSPQTSIDSILDDRGISPQASVNDEFQDVFTQESIDPSFDFAAITDLNLQFNRVLSSDLGEVSVSDLMTNGTDHSTTFAGPKKGLQRQSHIEEPNNDGHLERLRHLEAQHQQRLLEQQQCIKNEPNEEITSEELLSSLALNALNSNCEQREPPLHRHSVSMGNVYGDDCGLLLSLPDNFKKALTGGSSPRRNSVPKGFSFDVQDTDACEPGRLRSYGSFSGSISGPDSSPPVSPVSFDGVSPPGSPGAAVQRERSRSRSPKPRRGSASTKARSRSSSPRATYVCDYPGCTRNREPFIRKQDYQKHFRTHTREKPYPCRTGSCDKRFSDPSVRTRHEATHSGDKKQKCPTCGKMFKQLGSVRRHYQRSHAVDGEPLPESLRAVT